MSGTQITVSGADYSARNLGNTNPAIQVLLSMGVDPTSKFGLGFKTFYTTLLNANLISKFSNAYVYGGGTPLSDSIDIITNFTANKMTFPNDSTAFHTAGGYTPNVAAGNYGRSAFVVTQLANFHIHVYHNTAETNSAAIAWLIGVADNNAPADYIAGIRRNSNGQWGTNIDQNSAPFFVGTDTSYSTTTGLKTGLIRGGSAEEFYISGISRATGTKTIAPTFGNARTITVGGQGLGSAIQLPSTSSRFRFAGWGNAAWLQADETVLNNALIALEAALA